MNKQKELYQEEGNFPKGMAWGIALAVPLWLSIFGWIKILEILF